MDKRKNTFKKSQAKRREILLTSGKVSLSAYVNLETKKVLYDIKTERGYTMLGDAIDFLVVNLLNKNK